MSLETKKGLNQRIFLGYFNNRIDFILIVFNILIYGVLDVTSTFIGITSGISKEHNIFLKDLVFVNDWLLIFVLIKIFILGIFFLHYKKTNRLIGQHILLIISVYLIIGKGLWYLT